MKKLLQLQEYLHSYSFLKMLFLRKKMQQSMRIQLRETLKKKQSYITGV